jgi:hypothetical protein
MNVPFGRERGSGRAVTFPTQWLDRHLHLVGFTGGGKTTALLTLLFALFKLWSEPRCFVVIDRLGGFSQDLLRWFASPYCPPWVRARLIYVEGASEAVTLPINPLLYGTPGEGYYRTARAAEIVLRAWASQDLSQMPRLMRWLFNSLWAVAQLGLTVVHASHLLFPGSELHRPLLGCLPEALRDEWRQILEARGSQAEVQLESCRNRMKPFFDSPVLSAMFASPQNRFDVRRWMRERKIVVVNLAPMGRLDVPSADTLGGLIVNEVLSVARSLRPEERDETVLVLDEFQRFVMGSDLEFALAESRQLRVPMVLSHQSFSQLESDSVDLTSLIFQAQNRLILKAAGPDALILAEELAALTFDPMALKDEIRHRTQRVTGHRVVDLQSRSQAETFARNWSEQYGRTTVNGAWDGAVRRAETDGESRGRNSSVGTHQAHLPVYEEVEQVASRTYWNFEERKHVWARKLRELLPGQGVFQGFGAGEPVEVEVARTAPGNLALSWREVLKRVPAAAEAYYRLLEENFAQPFFVPPAVAAAESKARLAAVLRPPLALTGPAAPAGEPIPAAEAGVDNPAFGY